MLLLLLACVRPALSTIEAAPDAPTSTAGTYGPVMPTANPATLTPVPVDVPTHPTDATLGPADARVVVVTYSDYQCPFCAHLFPLLVSLAERRPDIRFVFESFPLHSDCNPLVQTEAHRFACDAALAASCANAQGRYVPMAELLYQYPEHITPPELPAFVQRAGLDPVAFQACFDAPDSRAALAAHVATAEALNIGGTPAVYARGLTAPRPDGKDTWVQITGSATEMVAALEAAPR